MSARFDCSDAAQRALGIEEAAAALRRGELVVLPTDTVYGVAADAFDPAGVAGLLTAKGRGRHAPPPVLVGNVRAASALVEDFGAAGEDLIDQFWPGGLTLVCRAARSLVWDLGDTKGTVAVRMPLHPVALDLLKRTGPLAVSSANRSGQPSATTAAEAEAQLGASIAVYLDDGPCAGDMASTIVDLTGTVPRLLRAGVVPIERLREVIALAVMGEANEEAPVADGDVPAADVPAADVEPPAVVVEPPAADVEAPVPDGEVPVASVEPSAADAGAPAADVEQPVVGPPVANVEAPAADVEAPSVDVQPPVADVVEVPGVDVDPPVADVVEVPGVDVDAPVADVNTPTASVDPAEEPPPAADVDPPVVDVVPAVADVAPAVADVAPPAASVSPPAVDLEIPVVDVEVAAADWEALAAGRKAPTEDLEMPGPLDHLTNADEEASSG